MHDASAQYNYCLFFMSFLQPCTLWLLQNLKELYLHSNVLQELPAGIIVMIV